MLYLLWMLINVGLALYALYLCFWATKKVGQQFGRIAALLFLVAFFSFAGTKENPDKFQQGNISQIRQWHFDAGHNVKISNAKMLVIQDNLVHQLQLSFVYGSDTASKELIPVEASSSMTGMTSGTDWVPYNISILPTSQKNVFRYGVQGTMEWKLLNITLYTESKNFSGLVNVY